jgi:formylglycine-generating enzyme required for sulfatase activity
VSWDDCQAFCQRLHKKTGQRFRLPTETEWEWACRAGTTTPFFFGPTISTDQANYDGNYIYGSGKKGVHRAETTPVGSFAPNAWGVFDTHGNVWEWCADWYGERHDKNSPAIDPPGPEKGSQRVLRGGSWYVYPGGCRSALRLGNTPSSRINSYGCRVACLD